MTLFQFLDAKFCIFRFSSKSDAQKSKARSKYPEQNKREVQESFLVFLRSPLRTDPFRFLGANIKIFRFSGEKIQGNEVSIVEIASTKFYFSAAPLGREIEFSDLPKKQSSQSKTQGRQNQREIPVQIVLDYHL